MKHNLLLLISIEGLVAILLLSFAIDFRLHHEYILARSYVLRALGSGILIALTYTVTEQQS